MRVSVSFLVALLSTPLLILADGPNSFKIPASGLSAKGGQPLDLQWSPTTTGTVSLILRSGKSTDLDEGSIIASHISNSGSYTWTPDNSITSGSDYTVEIVDDSDPTQVNYTPPFVLDTTNTQPQTLSQVTLGAPTATAAGGRHHRASATESGSLLTASSSSSFSIPIHNPFTHKTTGVTVSSATMSQSTGTASASSTASSTPTSQATSSSASAASNAAPRATAMAAGVFGLALGALAL